MFPGFYIGAVYVTTYGLCAAIGILAAFVPAVIRYSRLAGEYLPLVRVCAVSVIGVFFGMHLLYGITRISEWGTLFKAEGFSEFLNRFSGIFGGSVFYGGLLGGIIAGGISIRVQKLRGDIATDCLAPAIAGFHGFARIGCFMAGCCYGIEWKHGVTFTGSAIESANGVPRVPVQLFEAGFEFLLSGVLWFLLLKVPKMRGKLLALYLAVYSVGRFGLEFLRGDEYRGFVGILSTSQFISIFVFAAGLFLLIRPIREKE